MSETKSKTLVGKALDLRVTKYLLITSSMEPIASETVLALKPRCQIILWDASRNFHQSQFLGRPNLKKLATWGRWVSFNKTSSSPTVKISDSTLLSKPDN